jgi:hypothetical protein
MSDTKHITLGSVYDHSYNNIESTTVRIAAPNHISAGTFNGDVANGILIVGASKSELHQLAAVIEAAANELGT